MIVKLFRCFRNELNTFGRTLNDIMDPLLFDKLPEFGKATVGPSLVD